MKARAFRAIWLLIFSFYLNGCVSVRPWERGNLAKPQMALDSNPMQNVIRAHTYLSREAAGGSGGTQGGGCGCY
jgi:hypothetical protein